jgi:CBS domain-containing protein
MNVASVMTPRSDVVAVELPGTRDDALEYLQDREFSSVPVVKRTDGSEEYRGLLTRNALIENSEENQLALLMEDVPTTTRDVAVEEVVTLMLEADARRVPVVDGDGLEGIVTVTDVVAAIANGDLETDATVGSVANDRVNTTYSGTPLTVAERKLAHAGEPYAVVLDDDGEMTGIVTEVDVLAVARVVEGEDETGESMAGDDDDWKWESIKAVGSRYLPTRDVQLPTGPVAEFMSDDVVTVTRSLSVRVAAQSMIRHDVEQLPLVVGDDLSGVVRDTDLLEALDG